MTMQDTAKILVQALPYIQQYYGKTIVVKYGGNAMINDELRNQVMSDIILMKCIGIEPILVHGGGPEISKMLNKLQIESKFINGLRYTDKDTIDIVQMVLGGKVNKDIVSLIHKNGGKAIGLCGMDGALITAKKIQAENDLGYVGNITSINTDVIKMTMQSGYIPVVASVGISSDGEEVYNINADTCASKIASALKAEKLILLTDVPGVMMDPSIKESLISILRLHQIPKLTMDNIIKGGMIPKIDCCIESIRNGVHRTHILDGRIPHSILLELFSNDGIGTMIY